MGGNNILSYIREHCGMGMVPWQDNLYGNCYEVGWSFGDLIPDSQIQYTIKDLY
jgi:hypothetical protein